MLYSLNGITCKKIGAEVNNLSWHKKKQLLQIQSDSVSERLSEAKVTAKVEIKVSEFKIALYVNLK